MKPKKLFSTGYNKSKKLINGLKTNLDIQLIRWKQADLAFFYKFQPSPYGGGNQFLKALWIELDFRGLLLENNSISPTTQACLFNSYNFDFDRLRKFKREGCRMVHRVDGPMSVYRGDPNDDSDFRIWQINQELAEATIFQSIYSLEKNREMGLEFKSPNIIMNAANPNYFHTVGRIKFHRRRKIRLISTSWSANINKGAPIYKWLEDHLDWDRFEFTFIGNSPIQFSRIKMVPPLPPIQLAEMLRMHDIFIAASKHDPCSNSLIEALSCGLPTIFMMSGGHQEIVKDAGFGFKKKDEIPGLLETLVNCYTELQAMIDIPSISVIADKYLNILGF